MSAASSATFLDPGRCLIVGEVAQAHDGSLGMAHAFIDAIADAGADAVKFQTHIAAAESLPDEPWRVPFSTQDASRYDYWRRMELSEPQWRELAEHAAKRGLRFLSSPFSLAAVELLERLDVPAWKIASGELATPQLIDAVLATGKPLLISSGMSGWRELDALVARAAAAGVEHAVLQCTSIYPCPPERVGLEVLAELRRRYRCAVGLSDHSGTIFPGLAAVTLGIEILEVHVTLSRAMFGPDVVASVTHQELAELVAGVRFIERMKASPVDKDALAEELAPMRRTFGKSVVTRRALAAGTVLEAGHLDARKPGTGIPAAELPALLGRRLRRDVAADVRLERDDLEPSDD